ncbi:hypothetical protein D0863_13627 [Hortaea werneckii]|uniref:Palmitoyltransferase PFA4 n=1 Tax=Hortaea werneckii TaxID=91943 RepID=A0A3M7CR26_HORWE|nr:hypothetical protein D0863_13627 [Hortaea werneckii]
MDRDLIQRLAVPGVTLLICFLAYTSQWLFLYIEPGPLRKGDTYFFNLLVACLLVCFYRTCFTDPGRIPQNWRQNLEDKQNGRDDPQVSQRQRWCRRCETFKPPRAHHCKTCKRCVMKMDHHCVWTGRQRIMSNKQDANCISHITLPHFVRFLSYTVAAMIYLETFLYTRCAVLWRNRHMPSYLGPSMLQLSHLFVLTVLNSLVLFGLILLLGRTVWSLTLNMTTIESWEIERHEAVLRRARVLGGYVDGPDGTRVRVEHQEFPWDVSFWFNLCQGMGTSNPLAWIWPFARSPSIESGLVFEHNGIDDPSKPWPPPDPDRMMRAVRRPANGTGFTQPMDVDSFRARQAADLARFEDVDGDYVVRRRPFHERLEERQDQGRNRVYELEDDADETLIVAEDEEEEDEVDPQVRSSDAGEEGWRNKEGESLADFGVDEVVDFYDEDNVPLAELMRRRKTAS